MIELDKAGWEGLKVAVKGTKQLKSMFLSFLCVLINYLQSKSFPTHSMHRTKSGILASNNPKYIFIYRGSQLNFNYLFSVLSTLEVSLSRIRTRNARPRPEPRRENGRMRYWRLSTSRSLSVVWSG